MEEDAVAMLIHEAPRLNSIDAKALLIKAYEERYDLNDALENPRAHPMKLMRYNSTENVRDLSSRYIYMKKFITSGMAQLTGMSMVEFFELPLDEVLFLFDFATTKQAKDAAAIAQMNSQLQNK